MTSQWMGPEMTRHTSCARGHADPRAALVTGMPTSQKASRRFSLDEVAVPACADGTKLPHRLNEGGLYVGTQHLHVPCRGWAGRAWANECRIEPVNFNTATMNVGVRGTNYSPKVAW